MFKQETILILLYKFLDRNCYYIPGITVFGIICLSFKMFQIKGSSTLGKFFCLAAIVIYIIFFLDFITISFIDICQRIPKCPPSSMTYVEITGWI
jgi:hypothetical protein